MIYDFLIVGFLLADAALFASLVLDLKKNPDYAKTGKIIGLVVAGAAWVLVFYGSFIEPELLTIKKMELNISPAWSDSAPEPKPPGITIAVIADFHAGSYLGEREIQRVVERVNKEEPEIVLILGDFVSEGNDKLPALAPLKNLNAPSVYAILGNHDYIENVEEVLRAVRETGAEVLVNGSVHYEFGGARFAFVGLDDIWFGDVDFEKALADIPEGIPKILLVHNPDAVFSLGNLRFDAILAAHTHGGQIRMPGIGVIAPIPTELGRKYDRGRFDWRGMPLIITQGIGVTGPRARLFAPPEILILDLIFQM